MSDLYSEVTELADGLTDDITAMREAGCQLAINERDYRVALRKEILMLKAEGMAATITPDVARGKTSIAEMKMHRDSSEAIYKAAMEAVNVHKLQIRIINEQLQREWSQ